MLLLFIVSHTIIITIDVFGSWADDDTKDKVWMNAGMLECWNAGMPGECWNAGMCKIK